MPQARAHLVCWRKGKDGTAAGTERLSKRQAADKAGGARSSRVLQAQGRILDSITLLFFKISFFKWSIIDSCLENPMDRGAWQATVHWVARVRHD